MIKITITKEKIQDHIFEISQNELDAMLNHIHNKECDHKIKNFFIDIGANPNAIGISMYNVITMTPDQARSAMINEFEQDEPNIELIKNILDHSVIDINYEDTSSHEFNGYPLLHIASAKGYVEIVRMMLEKPEIDVNLQDKDGWTAIMRASRWGYTEIVKLLLERPEIEINLQTSSGSTALMMASYSGHIEIVQLLLERPENDINLQTKRGETALIWASYYGYTEVVKLLLERPEIDVNLQDKDGSTALTCILKSDKTMREKIGVIELLLSDNRVDVEDILINEELIKNSKIRKVIFKHPKIDINKLHPDGNNLLMDIVKKYRSWLDYNYTNRICKSIGYLLKHPKIDVSIKNKEGKTAWDIAPDDIKKLYPQLKPSTQS